MPTPPERDQLQRRLGTPPNNTPAQPLTPHTGDEFSGIKRNFNQVFSPFGASLPTNQDRPLPALRGGANFVLQQAGLPPLNELARIPFNDPRRAQADAVLHAYLYKNHLYGALAKAPGGQNQRIDHWTDVLTPSELKQLISGIEKTLLAQAVALSGINAAQGQTIQVPKREAFKQIGDIKRQVQKYFHDAWPDAAKPLLSALDALQSYTMDQNVDALRIKLTQSGRPMNQLISMGIGLIRTANPLAVINSLIKLEQAIAQTRSTQPLEDALKALGMSFKDLAGVGKDLAFLLAKGDLKGAQALLKKNYDLSTLEGQDRATQAIHTLLAVYGGAKLTQAGLKKLGIRLKKPKTSALVPVKTTPGPVQAAGSLALALEKLQKLTAQVDDAIKNNDPTQLIKLRKNINDALGEAALIWKKGGRINTPEFNSTSVAAHRALVRIDGAIKPKVPQPAAKKIEPPPGENNIVGFQRTGLNLIKTTSPEKLAGAIREYFANINPKDALPRVIKISDYLKTQNTALYKHPDVQGALQEVLNSSSGSKVPEITSEAPANLTSKGSVPAVVNSLNGKEIYFQGLAKKHGLELAATSDEGVFPYEQRTNFLSDIQENNPQSLIDAVYFLYNKTGPLEGAYLPGANLRGIDLKNMNLQGSDMSGANFSSSNLSSANLIASSLEQAKFDHAKLLNADLTNAWMEKSSLFEANLERSVLENTYLVGANLSGANLREANMIFADLTGC
jgi:hypothetical protein